MKKRTNIVIDEELLKAGLKPTGIKTRRALVDYALRDLLRRENQRKILELKGRVHWEGDLAFMRRRRDLNDGCRYVSMDRPFCRQR